MNVSVSEQAYMFFAMIVCGVFCGLVFDLFRSVRRAHRCHSGVVALQDITFWLAELVLVYWVAFKLNYAKVRLYELVALVIGSWLYFMTVSFYVVKILSEVIGYLIKAGLFIAKPFCKMWKLIVKLAKNTVFSMCSEVIGHFKVLIVRFEGFLVKKAKKMMIKR